jgi:acetyltransferase-like isoleucine patch superfamily enzyme
VSIKSKLAFNEKMLIHINESRIDDGLGHSRALNFLIKALSYKVVYIPLVIIEELASWLMTIRVPIYSSLIYTWINNARGLPYLSGMYLRALYYRRILKRMDSNVFIDQDVFFAHPEGVSLQEFSYIDKRVMILCKNASVGRRVHIAPNVLVSGGGTFTIHDYAGIATGVSVITSTAIIKDGARCSGPMSSVAQRNVLRGHVLIERDAFIGPHAVLLPNIIIKEGSVVTAGLTIRRNTDPWGIYVGESAKNISKRDIVKFDDD